MPAADGGAAVPPGKAIAMDKLPERMHPAHLQNIDRHNTAIILFVTVCASCRVTNTFANEIMHAIIREAWTEASAYRVGAYVVMPDHIHLFCSPATPEAENVAKWVGYWKRLVTIKAKARAFMGGASAPMPAADGEAAVPPVPEKRAVVPPLPLLLFQRDCWDRQLRSGESYHEKWEYVRNNPLRKGLATSPEEWPYAGVINDLMW